MKMGDLFYIRQPKKRGSIPVRAYPYTFSVGVPNKQKEKSRSQKKK